MVIATAGCNLFEMPRHADRACCADGGRIWVVACPKDVTIYRDAVKTMGYESKLQIKDLIELVYESM